MSVKSVFYRNEDAQKIARWLYVNVPCVTAQHQAEAIADLLVCTEAYDHDQPISDNRLGNHEFTIPAPSTLP